SPTGPSNPCGSPTPRARSRRSATARACLCARDCSARSIGTVLNLPREKRRMPDRRVAVLGTGMSGFGAGSTLGASTVPFTCYDCNDFFGGHTRSLRYPAGFVFDEGGHISFSKYARVRDILAENVEGRYEERRLGIDNYWHGLRVPHPVQMNLRKLPKDLI